jgi:phosphonate transport system ATP-binding protein
LTTIYGEEDWTAMRQAATEDADAEATERAQAQDLLRAL